MKLGVLELLLEYFLGLVQLVHQGMMYLGLLLGFLVI